MTHSLRQALNESGKRLGLEAKRVAMSHPAAALDVDKPGDHVLAEQYYWNVKRSLRRA